ncbi:TetR/AcrR family transcriptional regulator [Saccharothrix deserti]|uniref:TetR/AcrR family transcriptional regulator n=1 Tax=Saccharothrix deserti TaxID=2593674 RepID=UPI00131D6158|nr:TetR/AcrR family transcriptional regulator [Saccharothrix deserti]
MDLAGSLELLWGDRPGPRRGPKPALSHELIARTGIGIADAEGLAAVSMQRVAAELGFTKMSLYRYVPGKSELVALMADLAMGAPPADLGDGDWCDRLRAWTLALLPGFLRHPWVLEVTTGPRVVGPNELAWMESALAVLDGTGLGGAERMDALSVLAGHARNIAQQVATTPGGDPGTQLGAILFEVVRERGDRYPAVQAALTESMDEGGQDKGLDFGLDLILDGLRARVATRARWPTSHDSTTLPATPTKISDP